jgi:hypothetical protein
MQMVGISQIAEMFILIWREDDWVWDAFDNMIFGDLEKNDCVSHFYLIVEEI